MQTLLSYQPADAHEAADRRAMIALLEAGGPCFERAHLWAHFTGSALLTDRAGTLVLLNHHRVLDRWMHFGGHADGDPDLLAVAARELAEESGIATAVPACGGIFDIDIHPIPYRADKAEPAHLHYDVRYLFRMTDDTPFAASDESVALRWCGYEEARRLVADSPSLLRMLDKWRAAAA
jgi:8-oxo-dGTP pyrophosphatase MutT (NUDIX family)